MTIDIEQLLSKTDALIKTMYAVKEDLALLPCKEHIATCIDYSDLLEMRDDFVSELFSTVVTFVYSHTKQIELKDCFKNEGRDDSAAWCKVASNAIGKFRISNLKGQFCELLLFNLLQHYYKAAPLLRKMPITTNPGVERHGADAFHIAHKNEGYIIYVGEAKAYNRKDDSSFEAGMKDAIEDVIDKHTNHREELKLYIYDDFISPELEDIARKYKNGELKNIEIHLVCIVAYDNKDCIKKDSREAALESTIDSVRKRTASIRETEWFKTIPAELLPRFNYIIFPIKQLDELIEVFKSKIGTG